MLNGAQLHEINKLIATAATVAVVGAILWSEHQDRKAETARRKQRSKMTLIDGALDARDYFAFNKIIRDNF